MARQGIGSVLGDLRAGARFRPRPTPSSGIGTVQSPQLGPQSVSGEHYAQTRIVVPFSFDDSIDPTHPLDCFFQMPAGVLKLYSAKVWVKPAPFRAYETASTSGGSSTSSASGSHTHGLTKVASTSGTFSGLHSHTDPQGGATGSTDIVHEHGILICASNSDAGADHTHVAPDHAHGIAYGIFESAAATGTLGLHVANDGVTFGAEVASAASIATDIKAYLTNTAGDRQVRVTTTGAGAQARVKVLLMLDVLVKVELG